eukprot:6464548-Amphidinium_carterae.1
MLEALAGYVVAHSPLAYAYAENKSAESLQLTLSQATRTMAKWYGEVSIGKIDVKAAFDTTPWEAIYNALLSKGVPPQLASALLQLQQSGFVLVWEGTRSKHVFQPTSGTRQGCKLGPILYRTFSEYLLEPIAASWKWAPVSTKPAVECIGSETYGPNGNALGTIHLLLYADDIFVLTTHWSKTLVAVGMVRKRFLNVQMDIALHKTQIICMQGPCVVPFANEVEVERVGGPDDIMVVLG